VGKGQLGSERLPWSYCVKRGPIWPKSDDE
jgi:hypothetical protein